MVGVEITHTSGARLPVVATPAPVGYRRPGIDDIRLLSAWGWRCEDGLYSIILIALVSLLGSLSASVDSSVVAAVCLNYFFTQPLFDFRLNLPEDIEDRSLLDDLARPFQYAQLPRIWLTGL
jgi:hypothetical protein